MEILKEGFLRKNLGLGKEELIRKWLDEYKIENYTINNDLTIDVDGCVDLSYCMLTELPDYIQFGKVVKSFRINDNSRLISLRGCPKYVGGSFHCHNCNRLVNLVGAPEYVYGSVFCCERCKNLVSLKGAPKLVDGAFECDDTFSKDEVRNVCNCRSVWN